MKRWLVGALSLVLSLCGLVGNLAVQVQVNASPASEEYAAADQVEEQALRSSTSKRTRHRNSREIRFTRYSTHVKTLWSDHRVVFSSIGLASLAHESPGVARPLLRVFRI